MILFQYTVYHQIFRAGQQRNIWSSCKNKLAKIFTKKPADSCVVFYQINRKFISGIIKCLFYMKFSSNPRFPNIDIDTVNNSESNRKQTSPFCCVFRPQTYLHLSKLATKLLLCCFASRLHFTFRILVVF